MKENVIKILDDSMVTEDAVISMRGVAVMLDEFLHGNTIPEMCSAPEDVSRHIETRIEDILYFAIHTLKSEADKLSEGQAELERRILDAISGEG